MMPIRPTLAYARPAALALCTLVSVSACLNPHREVWIFCWPFLAGLLYLVKFEKLRFSAYMGALACCFALLASSDRFSMLHPIASTYVELTVPVGVYSDHSVDVLPADSTVLRSGMLGRVAPGTVLVTAVRPLSGTAGDYEVVVQTLQGEAKFPRGLLLTKNGEPLHRRELLRPGLRWLLLPSQWPLLLHG